MRYKTVFVVSLMLMSMLAFMGMPNTSAADKGYLEIDEEWGSMLNGFVNNGFAYDLGDQDIMFSVSVINTKYEYDMTIWHHMYEITDLKIKIIGQKDSLGNSVNILDFSDGESEVDYVGTIRSTPAQTGSFEADVVEQGQAGTYELTVKFEYRYWWWTQGTPDEQHNASGTDTDSVLIRIDDGLGVAADMKVFNEADAIVGHYLYAGTTFQKVGIFVQTNVGKIGQVTATIGLSPQTKSYITLDNPSAYTSQISAGSFVYFKYRVDVKDGTLPGRYDATLEVQYERWYGEDDQTTIIAESVAIEFIVDFTPLLTITNPEPYTITQGGLSTDLNEVTLENIGNTELKKIRCWIDIWNYFEQNDFYYMGDGGYRSLLPTEDEKEKLGKGETWQVDFMGINVFKYLPAGEHRLPLGYEGYYYDDGTAGGSSDYKLTDDGTYMVIKGEQLYITVIVTDNTHNFKVDSYSSIDLGMRMDDISVTFSVTNREDVDLLYTTITLGVTDGNDQLLINPQNPSLNTLEPVDVPRFPAQATQTFTLNADVVQSADAGFYELPVTIVGVNANTKKSITVEETVVIRVNNEPPRLIVTDIRYPGDVLPDKIRAGKVFNLEIDIKNTGNDTARDVFVTLLESQRNADVTVTTDFTPDAAKAEGMIEPFSTEISRIYIGDIAPGDTKVVTYVVQVDKNMVAGRNYEEWVTADYSDDLNRAWTYTTEISINVKGSQPEQEPDYSGITEPLIVGIFLIIVVFILVIIYVKVVNKPRRRYGSDVPEEAAEPEIRESSVPPPTASTTPVATTEPVGAQTFKVCPACHKSVPASNVTCPHCGCAM